MWIFDLGLFLRIYLISWVWQLISLPFIKKYLGELVDGGWAAGRVLSSTFIALVIFGLATFGLPINTNFGLGLLLGIVLVFSWGVSKKKGFHLRIFFKKKIKVILVEEFLLLGGIVFMGTMRGFWPNLDSLEKYMDFGFINQYLLNSKLPVQDMWFAGKQINYYSFGHFWSSVMIRSWNVSLNIVFALGKLL